jgi:lysophospholipid acyltransferase (LPLAT)-like uncharacterized protein
MNNLVFKFARRAAPVLTRWYLNWVRRTSHVESVGEERARELMKEGPVVFAIWHSQLLYALFYVSQWGVATLASKSRDGEIITRVLERLGYKVCRGSSSGGGAEGFKDLLRSFHQGKSLGLTVDGPRGPRERVKPGVAALAKVTGRPIIPIAYDATRKHVFHSWDRFLFPYPFARIRVVFGEPIWVDGTGEEDLERIRRGIETATELAGFQK